MGSIDFDDFFSDRVYVSSSRYHKQVPAPSMPQIPAFYLGSKSPTEIQQLNRSDLFTPNLTVESVYYGKSGYSNIGDIYYQTRGEMLRELKVLDTQEFKMNLARYGHGCYGLSPRETLKVCREIRESFPSGNQISKRAFTTGPGTAAYKFDFGLKELGVFFGVDGPEDMAFRGKAIKCCFGENAPGNWFFKRGKLKDWRTLVPPGIKLIYSNDSTYTEEGMGKESWLYDIYQDIVKSGYKLVYKHHIEVPLFAKVISWKKPRLHNMEVVCYVESGEVGGLSLESFFAGVREVNLRRTEQMLARAYKFEFPVGCSLDEIPYVDNESMGMGLRVKRKKGDRFADFEQHITISNVSNYIEVCLDKESISIQMRLKPLKMSFEFPVFFQDLPVTHKDARYFFYSARFYTEKCKKKMEFDKVLGWYAEK